MATNSSLPDFISCGYNWTGPVMGKTAPLSTDSILVGYISCAVTCILMGSTFVPFKFVKSGDGFFAQWVMCSCIFAVGLVVQLIRQQPIFFPETLMGGAIWAVGNCCLVPIINLIGLGLGMLIWNCSNILLGWATSRFGLMGLCAEIPSNEALNYVGVALGVCAGGIYIFVKSETKITLPRCFRRDKEIDQSIAMKTHPENGVGDVDARNKRPEENMEEEEDKVFLPNLSPVARRIFGILLALFCGSCFGVQFVPAVYVQQHYTANGARASQNGLDHAFAQLCGGCLLSTVAFIGYMIIYRDKAYIERKVILPSILSGTAWAIGNCFFLLATATLSPAITFPIIATVPGVIGTLWGIFMFGEIRGLRNFLILALAFSLTISGALLTAFSK